MKRKSTTTLAILTLCIFSFIFINTSNLNAETKGRVSTSTPLRFCIWPKLPSWPTGLNVIGANIGLPVSYTRGEKIGGVDFALLLSMSREVYGLQAAPVVKTRDSYGAEFSILNIAENYDGAQFGGINAALNTKGFQLGIINIAQNSKGVQVGLLNIMHNGFLPVFPFLNFGFK